MKPHSVIDAGHDDGAVQEGGPVWQCRGVEQEVIRHVGQQAAVQLLVIRQAADGAEPDLPRRRLPARTEIVDRLHRAELERTRLLDKTPHPLWQALDEIHGRHARIGQLLRRRHPRHLHLVLETLLLHLEGGGHVEYLLTVLNGDDPAVREALTIQAAVDLVDDRGVEIAPSQEVSVQRVDDTALYRRRGGGEGLSEHLPAKYLRAADIAAFATEQVDFQLLELEQCQQVGDALVQCGPLRRDQPNFNLPRISAL